MEYIEGTTIDELMAQNEEFAEDYLSPFIDLQVEMHLISATTLESMGDKLARQLREAKLLDDATRAVLLERLISLPVKNKLCHGNYHISNLIKTENRIVIIDWIDSGAGDPCADACRTYLMYLQHFPDWAEIYLSLYCSKSAVSRDDIFAWAPVVAGAQLSENVFTQQADYLHRIVHNFM